MTCDAYRCAEPAIAGGLCMRHYKQHRRGIDVHTPRPVVGDPSGHGTYGQLDVEGDMVRCHECGQWLRSVGAHLAGAHDGMTARDYKQRHGLPLRLPLNAPSVSARLSETAQERLDTPGWRRLEEARDPQAAADARDFTTPTAATMAGRAVRATDGRLPEKRARVKLCRRCGGGFTGKGQWCSPGCFRPALTEAEAQELREVMHDPDRLRAVVYRLYGRGVAAAQIGRVLGRGGAWMTKNFPQRGRV